MRTSRYFTGRLGHRRMQDGLRAKRHTTFLTAFDEFCADQRDRIEQQTDSAVTRCRIANEDTYADTRSMVLREGTLDRRQ